MNRIVVMVVMSGCSWATVRGPSVTRCNDAAVASVVDTVAAVALATVVGYLTYQAVDSSSYRGDGEAEKLGLLIIGTPALASAGLFTASAVHGYRSRCR